MADESTRSETAVAPPLERAAHVPEIYVDGYQGVTYKDGIVKLNYYSLALDPKSNTSYREVVLRLALSVGTVVQVHNALGQLLSDLETKGLVRRT